jgi:hypothetical protein
MVDRYTKTVLTVIALSLAALAIEQAAPPARAQEAGCGTQRNPCFVASDYNRPLIVRNFSGG